MKMKTELFMLALKRTKHFGITSKIIAKHTLKTTKKKSKETKEDLNKCKDTPYSRTGDNLLR